MNVLLSYFNAYLYSKLFNSISVFLYILVCKSYNWLSDKFLNEFKKSYFLINFLFVFSFDCFLLNTLFTIFLFFVFENPPFFVGFGNKSFILKFFLTFNIMLYIGGFIRIIFCVFNSLFLLNILFF